MKTKLLLLFVFITQFLVAQTSTITVFSQEGERFYVIVNGARQNDVPATNVSVTDLDKPNYLVKIIFEDQSISSLNQNVYLLDYDEKRANVTYNLKRDRKKKMKMSLNSFDYDISKTKGAAIVKYHEVENPILQVNVPNTKLESTTTKNTALQNGKVDKTSVDVNMLGIGINTSVEESADNMNVNINIGGLNTAVKTTTTSTASTSINDLQHAQTKAVEPVKTSVAVKTVQPKTQQDTFDSVKSSKECKITMANADFQKAKTSIEKQSFAESKLKVAQQITTANCLSAAQIAEVMNLFSFEGNKLDYAKFAYTRCVDKNNYYQINELFSFSSSTDELIEYIESLNN
jgi:hypothetical protein